MPQHIAIIMDGNGRWATERGLPRSEGHRAGARQLATVADAAAKLGVQYLTLYAFSTENWRRPVAEVTALMSLLREFVDERLPELVERNIRLWTIGRTDDLPAPTRNALRKAIEATCHNTGITVTLALSYGGRAEIADAVTSLLAERAGDTRPVTEDDIRRHLYHPDLPDPELMIRTGGEHRLSNFLLWQLSYAELYVTPVYWPDFGEQQLREAIDAFSRRERRFGNVPAK
ncbi:MAG: isoprenyl transferase [Oligosphaeraceae bacterium]